MTSDALAETLANAIDLHQQGQLHEAATLYLAVLDAAPQHPTALHLLGTLAMQSGEPHTARPLIELSLLLEPANAEALDHLGLTLRMLRQLDAAVDAHQRATALDPDNAAAWSNLGLALLDLGNFNDAIDACQRAIALDPDHLAARHNLAVARGELGERDDAVAELTELLALDPAMVSAEIDLARLRGASLTDTASASLAAWLDTDRLLLPERQAIHFLLGHAEDHRGDIPRAFAHFDHGNALAIQRFGPFDADAMLVRQRELLAVDRAFFDRHAPSAPSDITPIFIVGMPRSGTTVVERMLAAHPEVGGGGELPALHDLATALMAPTANRLTERTFPPDWRAEHARAYLDRHPAAGARWLTDKLPGLLEHLWLIALLFPDARVIHCVRDPLDAAMSCFARDFAEGHTWSSDLAHLATYHHHLARLAAHWTALAPLPILTVAYEDLVTAPASIGPRIFEHCALRWDDRYLHLSHTPRLTRPLEADRRAQSEVDMRSVGRWRRYAPFVGALVEGLEGEGRR